MEINTEETKLEDQLFWLTGEQVRVTHKDIIVNRPSLITDGTLFHVSEDCILLETAPEVFLRIGKGSIRAIDKLD